MAVLSFLQKSKKTEAHKKIYSSLFANGIQTLSRCLLMILLPRLYACDRSILTVSPSLGKYTKQTQHDHNMWQ